MEFSDKDLQILIFAMCAVITLLGVLLYTQQEGFHELCSNYCSVQGGKVWKYSAYSCGCFWFANQSNLTVDSLYVAKNLSGN